LLAFSDSKIVRARADFDFSSFLQRNLEESGTIDFDFVPAWELDL